MKGIKLYIFLILQVILLASCKPTIPSEYIQPGDMEEILYDYHIAMSVSEQKGSTPVEQKAYKLAVLKKHEITEEDFDSSLQFYMRHTEKLQKIYEEISVRMEGEAREQGISENDLIQYGGMMAKGDTTDIWNKSKAMVMSPYAPANYESFTIEADTSFHKGDRLVMSFDSKFIIQDGSRDAILVMSVTYDNDSVYTQSQHIMSDSRQTMSISSGDSLKIKSVRGFFLMSQPQETTSTFKLLILTNIRLIKVHLRKEELEDGNKDSLNAEPLRTVGGEPVNPNAPSDGTSNTNVQRTPQDAMRERNLPLQSVR